MVGSCLVLPLSLLDVVMLCVTVPVLGVVAGFGGVASVVAVAVSDCW